MDPSMMASILKLVKNSAKKDREIQERAEAEAAAKAAAEREKKERELAEEKKKEEREAKKRQKTAGEIIFSSCTIEGRKLDGMLRQADSIIKQTTQEGSQWTWAAQEVTTNGLANACSQVRGVLNQNQEYIQNNTMAVLSLKFPDKTEVEPWLQAHADAIDESAKMLAPPLGNVLAMHKARLGRLKKQAEDAANPSDKTKATGKKAKGNKGKNEKANSQGLATA